MSVLVGFVILLLTRNLSLAILGGLVYWAIFEHEPYGKQPYK